MDQLRKPLFIVSLVLVLLIVLVETGANFFPKGEVATAGMVEEQLRAMDPDLALRMNEAVSPEARKSMQNQTPPGSGIPDMALLDGLMLYTVLLMAASFFLTDRLVGRVQGIITIIVGLLVLIFAVVTIFTTLAKLLLMVGLFMATPFGTIAYLSVWGFFDRAGATAVLSLLLALKLAFAVCLILAHQRFLQNKGLVMIILCSLLANLIVSFLHGLVPVFLVSITDALAGIVVLIIAAVWAIVLLIGGIIGTVKAVA